MFFRNLFTNFHKRQRSCRIFKIYCAWNQHWNPITSLNILSSQLHFLDVMFNSVMKISLFQFFDLSTAIYQSNWYERPLKFQKTILIALTSTQMNMQFKAGGLIDVNLQSFVSVIIRTFQFCCSKLSSNYRCLK